MIYKKQENNNQETQIWINLARHLTNKWTGLIYNHLHV